jgi:hypothetical protein
MCLSLWVRSPKNYQDIRDSNMLILPSGRQLRKYKNKVNQEPGLNDEVLNWMYMAAKENQLEEHGYAGDMSSWSSSLRITFSSLLVFSCFLFRLIVY